MIGYKFIGWNTKPDGSGEWFTDEQEILNLTDQNKAKVRLYAQWQLCDNPLTVIADGDGEEDDGALYNGKASYDYTVSYGGTQNVTKSLVTPPAGYTVVFDTVGGTISGMGNTSLTNVSGTQGKTVKTVKDVSEWTINFATNSYMDYSGTDGTFHNEVDADFRIYYQ